MNESAWEMVKIVRDSENEKRIDDASKSLLSFAPPLDKDSVSEIIWEMTKIMRDSKDEDRRAVAQKILIVFKDLQLAMY
ncbi:MAG: hypothetical protein IIB00_07785 [candidate division Zixibacteria bacterium]|nr:hypothetical protein [candidate division Zixibacteria bacterium]